MSFEVTLDQAIAGTYFKGIKERSDALSDLRQILRHSQGTSKIANLKDSTFHRIFVALFDCISLELNIHQSFEDDPKAKSKSKAKGTAKNSKTTKSATETRLVNCAATLRVAVDVGVHKLRLKTLKVIIDHIIYNFPQDNGGYHNLLVADYSRCLSIVLGHAPLAEHLSHELWLQVTEFCVETVRSACRTDEGLGNSMLTARSSRPFIPASQASGNESSLSRQTLDDLVKVLYSLASVSFAPLVDQGPEIMTAMVQFVKTSPHLQEHQVYALSTINSVLLQLRTEDITYIKKFTKDAVVLAKFLWSTKLPALKDETLAMLVLLHPYVELLLENKEDELFITGVTNLIDLMKGDYIKRTAREQLQLSQLSLQLSEVQSSSGLRDQTFRLRDGSTMIENNPSSEHNWTLLKLLARFTIQTQLHKPKDYERSLSPGDGPQKRQRIAHWSDDLMRMLIDPNHSKRIYALQIIAFALQSFVIGEEVLERLIRKLCACILDENTAIVCWAHVALASCAGQTSARGSFLAHQWMTIWQYTLRTINPTPTCRTSSHLLHTIIRAELVDRSTFHKSMDTMLSTIVVNGPTVFSDSSASLLGAIIVKLRRENASLSTDRAGLVLTWLFRTWAPSDFHDKMFASQNTNFNLVDVLNLVNVCLGLPVDKEPVQDLPVWGSVAQSWILHEQTSEVLSYLLLNRKRAVPRTSFVDFKRLDEAGNSINNANATLVLGLCTTETTETINKWHISKRQGPFVLDRYMTRMVGILALLGLCLANCVRTKDKHRTSELHAANEKLLDLMLQDLSSPSCEQNKVDSLFDIVASRLIVEPLETHESESCISHTCMSKMSNRLLQLIQRRRELTQQESHAQNNDMSDVMDLDTDFESQATSHAPHTDKSNGSRKVVTNQFSAAAQRASVVIYAQLNQTGSASREDCLPNESSSEDFVGRILELPISELLASSPILTMLPMYGMQLNAKQLEPLLEYVADNAFSAYEYERAEISMHLVLGLMDSFMDAWTDDPDGILYTFGLDIYSWFMLTAVDAKLLSPLIQKQVVRLLLHILQRDAGYGQSDQLQPVRKMLFQFMKIGSLEVKYFIAQRISEVFSLFSLAHHHEILEELSPSLPTDVDWTEGIAIRLFLQSKLASKWHTLRKECIYRIFETAGMLPNLQNHAADAFSTIHEALNLKSTRQIFQLFAPQLLYSWLTEQSLAIVPFGIFGYDSMHEFLRHNLEEVYSQLIIREKDEEIQWLVKTLDLKEDKILRAAFTKSIAYAISWDVCITKVPDPSQATTVCESRLRTLFKTSSEYYSLVQSHFPNILAQMFISVKNEETFDDAVEKRPHYAYAKDALAAMKQYGDLDKDTPEGQQPCFKAKHIIDQLERVCRRTGNKKFSNIKEIMDTPHIAVALRAIIDCMHPAYGPLHTCQAVRKLRMFIALVGDEVFTGYPLQILIRTLRPVIVDPHCSDDAMGVLRYILEQGRPFLTREISMITGTCLLIILSLKSFMTSRQDKTTQESQFRNTVSKMHSFHDWLIDYLLQFQSGFENRSQQNAFVQLVRACRDLEFPASAELDYAASAMLKGLLDDEESTYPILASIERKQVISTICRQFQMTEKSAQDIFASDKLSEVYARRVWASTQALEVTNDYRTWAARVMGRAYACSVSLEEIRPITGLIPHLAESVKGQDQSTKAIVTKLNNILSDDDQMYVGVAEQSLRRMSYRFASLDDHDGSIDFEQILPPHVVSAISRAYNQDEAPSNAEQIFRREDLWRSAKLDTGTSFESWIQILSISLCRWARDDPILGPLEHFFSSVEGVSQELFPFVLHLALRFEVEKERVIRTYMSETFNDHFKTRGPDTARKSRLLLETLLYLLTQPFPGERTRMGRLEWLELDYLIAAQAASECNMPTAALYLGEMGSVPEVLPRSSRKGSFEGNLPNALSNELLLSIYSHVDDPDSFYGVRQSPSLGSVLARVHHEGDGWKGIMLHSARMDASLRGSGQVDESDSLGMIRSMGATNLNSLNHDMLHHRGNQSNASTTDTMLEAARKLEQWDLPAPPMSVSAASTLYGVFRNLATATSLESVQLQLGEAFNTSISRLHDLRIDAATARSTLSCIAVLNEVDELTSVRCASDLTNLWHRMQTRQQAWDIGRFNDAQGIVSHRETLFSLASQNKNLREALHVSIKDCRVIEAQAVISSSKFARRNDLIQQSLTAATYLSRLVPICENIGLTMDVAAQFEVATTLWRQGETSTSVQMLQDLCARTDLENQTVKVGRAGMLAQLGHEVAEARLENPEEVITNYLKPAIEQLGRNASGSEAGRVYHEFASFCDQQLQDPGNLEDFQRLEKLRERKLGEFKQYDVLLKAATSKETKYDLKKQQRTVHSWYLLDDEEYQKQLRGRNEFVQQSLQNYLRALEVSEEFNASVVRFFALWLEHSESDSANSVVQKYLPAVPSWKFVGLMNQQTSRLQDDKTIFQQSLSELISRVCVEHPYHGSQYLYTTCMSSVAANEKAGASRRAAAISIAKNLHGDQKVGDIMRRTFKVSNAYQQLANTKVDAKKTGKLTVNAVPAAKDMVVAVAHYKVPPATMSVKLQPSGDYSGVPIVARYREDIRIANGLSAPKVMVAIGTDGEQYKQLFKGGNDDLRQDAIMEQVFGEVSKMLQIHKASRQRNLHVRTYKVLPLTSTCGIIEFVPHSMPLGEFLVPAHLKYHPSDLKQNAAREKIGGAQGMSKDSRVKVYREVAAKHKPVLRHFFFERFQDPNDWFQKRLNYTRSTATISILGWILGLGDRHCHNILLDEESGEAIHIDLGVAFEAGRVLPVPEVVPFRLTRDIVDGMGVTKTEGVFRRCCEFSMDALRAEKDAIMTLLNVLRYDPLYSWTVSPLKARRMQEPAREEEKGTGSVGSRRPEDEAGEAARALAIVEKKLSKTLSTAATVNELIQQATDERNLAVLFAGWAPYA